VIEPELSEDSAAFFIAKHLLYYVSQNEPLCFLNNSVRDEQIC